MGRFYNPGSGQGQISGAESSYQQSDYSESLNTDDAESLLDDNRFIQDIYDYYGERDGTSFGGQKEAVEHFLNDRRWRNFNTVAIGKDVYDAHNQSAVQSQRLARIQKVYDALPNFTGGVGSTLADVALPLLLDPLNLVGFGSGGAAARAAVAGAKGLTKNQLLTKGLKAGAYGGAKGEAVAGGIAEGIADIGIQNRNIEIGLQDEFSYMQLAGSTAFGAATGGAMGAGMGAVGAVAPVRNLGVGKLNFDDSAIAGDQGGMLNKAGGFQATKEDMTGENLQKIADSMGISIEEAQKLTRSSIGRGQIDAAIRDSDSLLDALRPQASARIDAGAGANGGEETVPWGENLDDNQVIDELVKGYEQEISSRGEFLNPTEGQRAEGLDVVGASEQNRVNLDTDPDIINARKNIAQLKWVQEWHKSIKPNLLRKKEELLKGLTPEELASNEPPQSIRDIDTLIADGNEKHRRISKFGRDLVQKGAVDPSRELDDYISTVVDDQLLLEGPNTPQQIVNQNAGQQLLPDNSPDTANVNAEIGRTVQGEGFETEVAGGTVTRDDGTKIAEGAAVEPITDEAGIASDGDARVEGTRAQKEQRVGELKQRLSRRKGSLEHDKRFAKQELAKAITPEEIDAANKKIADLDNERRDAKVELSELEGQLEETLDTANPEVQAKLTEAADEVANEIDAEIDLEVDAELTEFRERFLSADQMLEAALVNFKATKANTRTLLTTLGYDASKVKEIQANMPKGNTTDARTGRLMVLKNIIEAHQGREAFNGMLRIAMKGGDTIPVHLLDDAIVDALIVNTVPERLQPHAFQHFHDWKQSQMDGIIATVHFEVEGLSNTQELKSAVRSLFGNTKLVEDIDAYIDSGLDRKLQNANPNKFDGKGYVDEQLARLQKQNPNLANAWNDFQKKTLANFLKGNKNISEARAKQLFDGVVEEMWDKFSRTETFKRVSNHGQTYSVKGLTTKTMNDVSVDETQITGGDYMGRSINRLGNYTSGNGKQGSGRDITNKDVGKIQSILRSTRPDQDYFDSSTFDTVTTTVDGVKRIYTGGAAARILDNQKLLESSKSQAMVNDGIKRQRSINLAEKRKGTEGYRTYQDVIEVEGAIKKIKSAKQKIARLTKDEASLDEELGIVPENDPRRAKLETRFEKALADLQSGRQAIQAMLNEKDAVGVKNLRNAAAKTRYVKIEDLDDASLLEEAREMLVPLTKSTRQEVNANVVEERRTSVMSQMADLKAERIPLLKEKGKLVNAGGPPSQNLLDITLRLNAIRAELVKLEKKLTPAELKRIQNDDYTVARNTLANIKREARIANQKDNKPLELNDEELLDAVEETTGQRPKMDDVAQIEEQIMNMGLSENQMNSQLASLKQFVMDNNVTEADAKAAAKEIVQNTNRTPSKPTTKPSGVKRNPTIVQIGEKAYDLSNDIQWKSIGKNKAEVNINGKKLGTVEHNGATDSFSATIIKQDGSLITTAVAKSKKDMNLAIAQMFRKELDEIVETKDIPLEGVVADGPMNVTDWHQTNRYRGKKDSPKVTDTEDYVADASPENMSQQDPAMDIVPSEFDLPEEQMLTIQIIDPKHPKYGETRNFYQGDDQTVGQVAGTLKPEQYVVGQSLRINPKTGQINKNSNMLSKKTFRPLNSEDMFVNVSGTMLKGKDVGVVTDAGNSLGLSPRARVNKPLNVAELDNMPLTQESLSPKMKAKRIQNGDIRTVGDLRRFADEMENIEWSQLKTVAHFDFVVSNLEGAYETLNKLAPSGIKLPNETRVKSYNNLKKIITSRSEADVAQMLSLFNNIAGSQNRLQAPTDSMMPKFEKFKKYAFHRNTGDAQSNTVFMKADATGPNDIPDAVFFTHEMGHWAYANMLTDAEKLQFWGVARKYMTQNDGMDTGMLKKKLPGFMSNEIESPAEFFANQFTIYAMNRTPGATQSLFEKVAGKIKQLIGKVLKMEEPLDPDLIPLFEKIMPDPQKATGTVTEGRALANQFDELMTRLKGIDLEKNGAVGIAAQELHDLRALQIKLEKALSDNSLMVGGDKNTAPLQDVLKEVASVVYGKYGGQGGSKTHKSGAKRITLLDSYSKGKPAVDRTKPEITLPNGKTMHPFYFMNARIARGRLLGTSNKIHRTLYDEKAMSSSAELEKLIAEQRADQMSTIEDEQLAMIDNDFMALERVIDEDFAVSGLQGSGSLGSTFDVEANILRSQSYLKPDDANLEKLLVGQANDMIVALDSAIDEYTNVFNRNMRQVSGGVKAPAIDKAGRIFSAGNSVAKKYQKKAYNRNNKIALAVMKAIDDTTETFGDMPPIVDAPVRKSPKDMSDTEILENIHQIGTRSPNTKELKQEIFMRRRAEPVMKPFEDLTPDEKDFYQNLLKDVSTLPKAEQVQMLRGKVDELINQGSYDDANMVIGILSIQPGVVPVKPKASLLGRALDIEYSQGRKADASNGVPGDAPPAIKEVLTKITHRDKNIEHGARTMLYRMLNLLGRTARDNLQDNTTFMSVEDLYRMSGTKGTAGTKAAFTEVGPTRGKVFNDLRKDLRRYAIGINEGKADPLDIMHEVGHMVSRSVFKDQDYDNMLSGFTDALRQGDPSALAMRDKYSKLPPEAGYDDKNIAEEWFVESWAQWMSEKVAKGDLFKVRYQDGAVTDLKAKSYLMQLANDLYDYTAYILNGLMGRTSMKQMFRQMTYHGDMFTPKRLSNSVKNSVDTFDFPLVNLSVADRYARNVIDTMAPEKKLLAREFVGAGPDEDLMDYVVYHGTPAVDIFNRNKNPDVYLHSSDNGAYGPGVYVTPDSSLAGDFGGPDAMGVGGASVARARIITQMKDKALVKEAENLNDMITNYDNMIMEADYDRFGIDDFMDELTGGYLDGEMDKIRRSRAAALEAFAKVTGFKTHPGIMPLFVKKKNVMDFSQNKIYSLETGEPNDMLHFVTNLQMNGVITPEARVRMVNKLSMDADFDGELFYSYLLEAISPNDLDGAKIALAKHLQTEGYDGIKAGDPEFSQNEQFAIFSPNNVKHIDAETFDSDRRGIYYSVLGSEFSEGLGGAALTHMVQRDRGLDIDDMIGVSRALQEAGTPDMAKPMKKMLRGEEITPDDANAVQRNSSVLNYFRENSQRLRLSGANWLADFVKPTNGTGLYERHDIDLADKIMPIFNILKTMPDNDNWAKRWGRKNAYLIPNIGKLSTLRDAAAQPASHRRILNAIRRGEFEVRKLEPREQQAARLIIQTFEAERQNLLKQGLPVGDTRKTQNEFYVPQQWDTEGIRQNPKAAMEAFTRFFTEERKRPDFEATGNLKNPRQVAEDLVNAMMDTSGEVYGDDVIRRAVGDPFFSRLIKLDPDQYDYMTDFLVNDLEGLVTQYFDRTTRKIAISDKLGTGGHGYASYITVAERGLEGAKDALMNSAKRRYKFRQYQSEVDIEQQVVARATATEIEVDNALDKVKILLGEGPKQMPNNKQSIKNILMNLYDPEDMGNPQVKIRVDSIANALVDFNNTKPSATTLSLADNMIDVINKRPITKYSGNELSYKVSRNVKAFNAISLLGFTTLTSLGDVVLPLIRSGNMGAFVKAQAKYMTDPTYRQAAKNIGLSVENLMHDRMVQMAGEGSQKLQNSFFNFTLLTPWTNMQREIAGIHGFEAFKAEIARARRFQQQGQITSSGYKTAVRFLERYGLTGDNATTDFLADGAPNLNDIRDTDVLSNKALRYGLLRFTNEAIFTPNPNDIPMWAQTPFGSMFFQLKSFQLMMARMSKYIIDEAKQNNIKPAMYMLTAGIGAGFVANVSKDFAQSRGGEEGESRALRERSLRESNPLGIGYLAGTLGLEEDSTTDEVLGNYFEGLLSIGGLGLFGELMYNTASQADNGAYGKVRVASAIFGPSVGLGEDIFDVGIAGPMGLFDDEGKNARRREAVRSVIGRVPIAGGIRGFKENAVDYIAGEAGDSGKRSSPKSFSANKKGFGGSGFGKGGF